MEEIENHTWINQTFYILPCNVVFSMHILSIINANQTCTLRVAYNNYFAVSPTCFGLNGALSRSLIQKLQEEVPEVYRHGHIKIIYTLVSDKTMEYIIKNNA